MKHPIQTLFIYLLNESLEDLLTGFVNIILSFTLFGSVFDPIHPARCTQCVYRQLKKSDYELSQTENGLSRAPSTHMNNVIAIRLWLDSAGLGTEASCRSSLYLKGIHTVSAVKTHFGYN